jgi:O-antigen/teichoic acid export membrane protein
MENTKWLLRLTFLVVLFFVVEKSLFFVGISYLMAGILSFFFLFWGVFFRHHVQFNLLFFNFEEAKRIFRFSGWLLFSKMSAFVLYRMNVLVIGIFLEPVYLTYYNLAFKIYEPVKYGLSILSSTLVSVASRLSVMSDIKRITNLFKKSTYYMIAIMLPVITFVFFQAGNIINIWMGENYGVSIRLLKLFMISIIPLTLTVSGTEMLLGLDKFKFLVIYGCLGAAMSFLINLVFISFIGLDATLYGLILGSSLSSAGYLRVVIKNFDIRLMQFLKNLPYKSLLFAFVLVFLFASVKNLYFDITFLACYYLMFFFFFMDVSDRKDIISIIKP